jgi:glyoxylase-like metal-dependent hydrolase (beta-lactamase superfamily II)
MHWDHVGGIEDFQNIKVWTDKNEKQFAFSGDASYPEFTKEQYDSPKVKWKDIDFKPRPYENFDKSYDFYGDGTIVIVPLYGHTPGSIGIFVNKSPTKRYLFIGDLAWLKEGYQIPAHKSWIASKFADRKKEMVEKQLIKVHQLNKLRPEIIILPAHDLRTYKGHVKELK